MKNAAFREWEFGIMEKYLRLKKAAPIDSYFYDYEGCMRCERIRNQYHYNPEFIIVYLEDIEEVEENKRYNLLLDFFTFSDYVRFINTINIEGGQRNERNDENDRSIPRSTFFVINNYKNSDKPIKGAHYYLNLWELQRNEVKPTYEEDEGFPLLFSIDLTDKVSNERLLYLTTPLIYPQLVFSGLQDNSYRKAFSGKNIDSLRVWNVGQGNYNELIANDKPYIIYDAGTQVIGKSGGVKKYKQRLHNELGKEKPMFVLSHWHTDHYSLLFSLGNNELREFERFVMPSYVKNLSVFLFVARLNLIGADVAMIKLPHNSKWKEYPIIDDRTCLYANKYEHNSINDSGLCLFVKGENGNVMLSGDCKYTIAEGQAKEAIKKMTAEGKDLHLVVPHHGGNAGKTVTFNVPEAKNKFGYVSVGVNDYGHPKEEVMEKLALFLNGGVKMTKNEEDMKGKEYIEVGI